MNNTEKLLVELLSSFANEREPIFTTEYDREELYELAKAQSVTGIVCYVLRKWGRDDLLSGDNRLSSAFDKTITQIIRREFYVQKLFEKLSDAGIPHIIFKGIVVKSCYPVAELRTYGDIDIIIREEDRENSHSLMLEAGYSWKFMDGGDVYSYKKGTEHYEFHTTLNSEKTKLSDSMNDFWSFARCVNGCTYEFENEFHLCYLISHIEKHVYGAGAGIRMYLDIALFLKKYKDSLDFEKVRKLLRECELERFFDTVLELCSRWFDCEVKSLQCIDEKVYEEFCRYTFKGGVFGVQDKENCTENEVRQAVGKKGKAGKLTLILSHIFPPYREVRRIYPFFNGKPYLLPIGWVVHFFKAAKRSGVKNLRQIANVDIAKAQSDKEFLEQIGSKR